MAITLRKKGFSINLGSSVSQALESIRAVRITEQARKGAEFQKAVAAGMSYEAQTSLLQKMITQEEGSPLSDPSYIDELKINLGNTQKMARFERIRGQYKDALDAYVTDKGSLQGYIKVLEDTMSSEVDDKMKGELRDLLSDARKTQSQNELNAIQNRALLAQKDNSIPMLEKSVKEINDKKAIAALNGNDDEVAKWDETLFALQSSKSKLQIEDGLNDLTFKINRNNPKANDKIGYLNEEISKADSTAPVTYNGVTYDSLKGFWEDRRNEYVSTSYFDEVQKELNAETAKIASTNNFGQIPVARIKAVSAFFDNIASREEFAPFIDKIEQIKIANVDEMTTNLSSSLYDEFNAKVQAGDVTELNYNSELAKVENSVVGMENSFGVKLQRQATTKEVEAGGGILSTVDEGMKNLPVKSSFSEANQGEIKRAQDVYLNADKLAGTGKYANQTADQIREAAHNYANDIRKGVIDRDVVPGITTESPAPTPTVKPEVPVVTPPVVSTQKLVVEPPVAPEDTSGFGGGTPSPKSVTAPKTTITKPMVQPTTKVTAPAETGIMYNGRRYKDQAAVDRVKRREAQGVQGF